MMQKILDLLSFRRRRKALPAAVAEQALEALRHAPDAVRNLARHAPEALDALSRQAPRVVDKVARRAPDAIDELTHRAPKIAEAARRKAPDAVEASLRAVGRSRSSKAQVAPAVLLITGAGVAFWWWTQWARGRAESDAVATRRDD